MFLIVGTWALLAGAAPASAAGCAGSEIVVNGSFETGTVGWSYSMASGTCGVSGSSAGQFLCGIQSGRLALTTACELTHAFYQDVTIPAGAMGASLSFSYRMGGDYCTFNNAGMQIRDFLNNVLATPLANTCCSFSTCAGCSSGCTSCCGGCSPWATVTYGLSSFQGQTIRLWFQQVTSAGVYPCAEVYFDCVSVCIPGPTATATQTIIPVICLPLSCSGTFTHTFTITPTWSRTWTATRTPTPTASGTETATDSPTESWTISGTATITGTETASFTESPTGSATLPATATPTASVTSTPSRTTTSAQGSNGAATPLVYPVPATSASGVWFAGLAPGSTVFVYTVAGDQVTGSPLTADATGRARWTARGAPGGVYLYLVKRRGTLQRTGALVLLR